MSQHDPHDEHTSFIKTPQQLIAVIVLAFAVPVLGISMLASLVSHGGNPDPALNSDAAVAKRLKPVGESMVDPNAPPPPPAAAAPAVVAAAPGAPGAAAPASAQAGAGKGKAVHDATCMVCHGTGVAGAPKTGDKAAWAPRLKEGVSHLVETALKGKGAMPPKGGNPALSDADLKAAVEFMVSQSK